jgi:hypothetical protein
LDCVLHSGIEPQADRRESRKAMQNTVILHARGSNPRPDPLARSA